MNRSANSMALHKGNKQIGKAQTPPHRASPINFAERTGNRNMFNTRQQRIKKSKQCPTPQSQGQHPTIGTILDQP
jgi:hypothetical protein